MRAYQLAIYTLASTGESPTPLRAENLARYHIAHDSQNFNADNTLEVSDAQFQILRQAENVWRAIRLGVAENTARRMLADFLDDRRAYIARLAAEIRA